MYPRMSLSSYNLSIIAENFDVVRYSVFKEQISSDCSDSGDEGIRTLDPLLARQVLSQLSYTPKIIWHPPALPCRLQHSTIGRPGLNHRVRDGNGCVPRTYRHQMSLSVP